MLDGEVRPAIPSTGTISAGLFWSAIGFGRKFAQMPITVRALDSTSNDDQFILLSEARHAYNLSA